jgi:arylsulfatase A-like enzyme
MANVAGLAVLVLLLAAGATGCGEKEGNSGPNVLLVSVDTLRRDHMSIYGYGRETTPQLDALAREGVVFERAVSPSNWTLPAHGSLLTGLTPARHGLTKERGRLGDTVPTLAEAFRAAGYDTAGFASHVYLGERYGFARGFRFYEVEPSQRAEAVTERALSWLQEHGSEPFFLFLHYFDPHWDYAPPPPWRTRFGPARMELGRLSALFRFQRLDTPFPESVRREVLRLYDGEIAYTDDQIGRLLDALRETGQLDRTVVALVSDHGEEFGERGSFGHGTHLHAEVIRIPFIVRYPPRLPAGQRRPERVDLTSLPATLLDLAGLRARPGVPELPGLALFAEGGLERAARGFVLSMSQRRGPLRWAAYRGRHKLASRARWRPLMFEMVDGQRRAVALEPIELPAALFDVLEDPAETRDLARDPQLAGTLQALEQRIQRERLVATSSSEGREIPAEEREALRALGYVE